MNAEKLRRLGGREKRPAVGAMACLPNLVNAVPVLGGLVLSSGVLSLRTSVAAQCLTELEKGELTRFAMHGKIG
jgi:hypothetical protein